MRLTATFTLLTSALLICTPAAFAQDAEPVAEPGPEAPAGPVIELKLDLDEGAKRRFELNRVTKTTTSRGERETATKRDVTYEVELTVTKELANGAYRASLAFERIRGKTNTAKGEVEFDERANAPEGHRRSREMDVALVGATVTFELSSAGAVSDIRGLDEPIATALRLKPALIKSVQGNMERLIREVATPLPDRAVGAGGDGWPVAMPFEWGILPAPVRATSKLESAAAGEATLTSRGAPELDMKAFGADDNPLRQQMVKSTDASGSTFGQKSVLLLDDGLPKTKTTEIVFKLSQKRAGIELKTVINEKTTLRRIAADAGR